MSLNHFVISAADCRKMGEELIDVIKKYCDLNVSVENSGVLLLNGNDGQATLISTDPVEEMTSSFESSAYARSFAAAAPKKCYQIGPKVICV